MRSPKIPPRILIRPLVLTVPEPTDYAAKLEAARRRLRESGNNRSIDPPLKFVPEAARPRKLPTPGQVEAVRKLILGEGA